MRRESRWLEIFEELKMAVETGALASGHEYPSESELMLQFDVSRTTIRRVLSELFKVGFVSIRPGKRREVSRPEPVRYSKVQMNAGSGEESFGCHLKNIARRKRWTGENRPYDEVIVAPQRVRWYGTADEPRLPAEDIRKCFRLKETDHVTWFLRARCARGNPLVLQWVVTPVSMVPIVRRENLEPGGLSAVYAAAGIVRHSYSSMFLPTAANSSEARYLKVESGTPLIEERRLSRSLKDGQLQVYELLVTLYSNRISLDFEWELGVGGPIEPDK